MGRCTRRSRERPRELLLVLAASAGEGMKDDAEFAELIRERAAAVKAIRAGMSCEGLAGDPCGSDMSSMLSAFATLLRQHGWTVTRPSS